MTDDPWDVERLLQGVPSEQRAEVWVRVSGIEVLQQASKGLYPQLLAQLQTEPKTEWMGDIDRDVPRVGFPASSVSIDCAALGRVLKAFCLWHPSVCYCQPMGFIAGCLLLQLKEEQAFFGMIRFHTELAREYWCRGMVGWKVDEAILTQLLETEMPALVSRLKELGMQPAMIFTSWVQCLYLCHLDPDAAARIWDVLLCTGVHLIHSLTLAVFKSLEQQLIAAASSITVFQLLKFPITPDQLGDMLIEAVAREPELHRHYTEQRVVQRAKVLTGVRELFERHYDTQWEYHQVPLLADMASPLSLTELPSRSPSPPLGGLIVPSPPLVGLSGPAWRSSCSVAIDKSTGQSSVRMRDDSMTRRFSRADSGHTHHFSRTNSGGADELLIDQEQGLSDMLNKVDPGPTKHPPSQLSMKLILHVFLLVLCCMAALQIVFMQMANSKPIHAIKQYNASSIT